MIASSDHDHASHSDHDRHARSGWPRRARALQSVVIPLIQSAQGDVLCRGVFREAIVGDDCPQFIAVMQFPDVERIHAMFASAAYRAAIPDRQRAFRDMRTFVSDSI